MKTVVVAMSGGVDSSTTAFKFLENGYNVVGVTMAMGRKCDINAIEDARIVCNKIGIKHYVLDVSNNFIVILFENKLTCYGRNDISKHFPYWEIPFNFSDFFVDDFYLYIHDSSRKELYIFKADEHDFNKPYIISSVESVEKNEETSKIKVVMTYDSPDDYKKFNGKVLFYGTVKEAEKAGYTLTDKLVDSERKAPDKNILKKYKNKHVIIVEDKTTIFVPYNIDYVSVGARYTGKKGVDLSGCSTQLVEILLSK